MKTIQALDVWVNGEIKQATQLTLVITFDNLETEAVFKYNLSDAENNSFVEGLLTIDGAAYQTWGQSTDANTDAYNYAASALNLVLA